MLFNSFSFLLFLPTVTHVYGVAGIVTLCVFEILQGHRPMGAALRPPWVWQRWGMHASLTIGILLIGVFDGGQFIYFQF